MIHYVGVSIISDSWLHDIGRYNSVNRDRDRNIRKRQKRKDDCFNIDFCFFDALTQIDLLISTEMKNGKGKTFSSGKMRNKKR